MVHAGADEVNPAEVPQLTDPVERQLEPSDDVSVSHGLRHVVRIVTDRRDDARSAAKVLSDLATEAVRVEPIRRDFGCIHEVDTKFAKWRSPTH